jgi:plastocyanin
MRTRTFARPLLALSGLLLVGGLAACGDDDDAADDPTIEVDDSAVDDSAGDDDTSLADGGVVDDTPADDGTNVVVAEDFSLTNATAAPGATVTFDNQGAAPHTLTADDDSFDTGRVEPGGTGEITAPDAAGTYAYHCDIHPAMTGTLTVV